MITCRLGACGGAPVSAPCATMPDANTRPRQVEACRSLLLRAFENSIAIA